jgi:hypothetical protein
VNVLARGAQVKVERQSVEDVEPAARASDQQDLGVLKFREKWQSKTVHISPRP